MYKRSENMKIEIRTLDARQTRLEKMIPGIVYGKGFDSKSVQVPYMNFITDFHKYGTTKTFPVTINKEKHIVYIKEVQYDDMDIHKIMHFDLVKVSSDDTLHGKVSIVFKGRDLFAKGMKVLTIISDEIEVEYKVGKGIASIEVDLSVLTDDQPIYIGDIKLPNGVTCHEDPKKIVASLTTASEVEIESDDDDLQVEAEVEEE